MSYTPPAGGAIAVELASGAYTPPASSALNFELASGGGATGQVEFVNVHGALALVGFVPSKVLVKHTMPYGTLTVVGYTPVARITKKSILSVTGALSVAGFLPSAKSTKVSSVTATGALALSLKQPTYFKGKTEQIAAKGSLTITGYSGITHTRVSRAVIPTATLTLAAYPITHGMLKKLGVWGSLALAAGTVASQRQKIRAEIVSRYFTPDVTVSNSGEVVLTAYPPTYAYRVRNGVVGQYGSIYFISAQIVGMYTDRILSYVQSEYQIQGTVASSITALYTTKNTNTVRASVEGKYRFTIVSGVEARYSVVQNVTVRKSVVSSYTMVQVFKVRAGVASLYSALSNSRVTSAVTSTYSFQRRIDASVFSAYALTSPIRKEIACYYNLASILKARAEVVGIYSGTASQVLTITEEPYLEYQGGRVGVTEAEISVAEGDYAWKATVVLSNVSDYARFRQDQPFSLVVNTERFEFIVDSKEMDRSNPANHAMKLLGISPSAKLTSPRFLSTTYLWDIFMQASEIAEELIPGVDWQVLDWGIPAYRMAVQDTTPIEAVRVLAEAIGAVLESNIDGTLYVRSLFPVSVPNYPTTTPAHTLVEATDILSVNESYVSYDTFNRLVVTDISQDIADSLEWIADYTESTTGTIRAFLYPWRSAIRLTHTGLSGVSIGDPVQGMVSHEEVIEIFQGAASTEYPIHHIESVEYEAANTGAVLFDVDSRSFTVGGPSFNSVIRIVYWTRSLDYRVSLPEARPTQFLLESEPL